MSKSLLVCVCMRERLLAAGGRREEAGGGRVRMGAADGGEWRSDRSVRSCSCCACVVVVPLQVKPLLLASPRSHLRMARLATLLLSRPGLTCSARLLTRLTWALLECAAQNSLSCYILSHLNLSDLTETDPLAHPHGRGLGLGPSSPWPSLPPSCLPTPPTLWGKIYCDAFCIQPHPHPSCLSVSLLSR